MKVSKVTNNTDSVKKDQDQPRTIDINAQQVCKKCKRTFTEMDNHDTACNYHPGPPLFHDRSRGVSCLFCSLFLYVFRFIVICHTFNEGMHEHAHSGQNILNKNIIRHPDFKNETNFAELKFLRDCLKYICSNLLITLLVCSGRVVMCTFRNSMSFWKYPLALKAGTKELCDIMGCLNSDAGY